MSGNRNSQKIRSDRRKLLKLLIQNNENDIEILGLINQIKERNENLWLTGKISYADYVKRQVEMERLHSKTFQGFEKRLEIRKEMQDLLVCEIQPVEPVKNC